MADLKDLGFSPSKQTLFSALPEILINIYAYSLNPSFQLVDWRLWFCLGTESARLSFSASAFSSYAAGHVGMAKACQLQKWLLRKEWFTDHFAANVEKTIVRDYAATTSIMPSGGARDVEIPARLLKGVWSDERLNLLERLMRWGSYILATPPILDTIPECLLKQAIAQRNRRALDFCMHEVRVKPHPQMWQSNGPTQRGKLIIWSSVRSDHHGIGHLDWEKISLLRWAEAKAEEGDLQGEWLLDVLVVKYPAGIVEGFT